MIDHIGSTDIPGLKAQPTISCVSDEAYYFL